uniref:helix-turn-helix domain-containing protein n=1 Tax=Amycolatopsis sp. lyj-346 TaxID=2789289 RepID=UPI003978CB84
MDHAEIGERLGKIRHRRGVSLDTAAGLAGISKAYWSMLENGKRRFERRRLLEDLAGALGCAVADLTGQPYLPGDQVSAEALASLPVTFFVAPDQGVVVARPGMTDAPSRTHDPGGGVTGPGGIEGPLIGTRP